jgi:hypothetical protein
VIDTLACSAVKLVHFGSNAWTRWRWCPEEIMGVGVELIRFSLHSFYKKRMSEIKIDVFSKDKWLAR